MDSKSQLSEQNTLNQIIRRGSFDAGHRVMFQRFKCAHLHGHRYDYELCFGYQEMLELGYAIDFSEIKRIGGQWIDDHMDHSFIVNPKDEKVLKLAEDIQSKCFVMHLLDSQGSCNPTVENISKELFFAIDTLMSSSNLKLQKVTLYETANSIGVCHGLSDSEKKLMNQNQDYIKSLTKYKSEKGSLEYDSRKS